MDLTNKNELIKYLKENGLWAKKSLAQNFLVDRNVLNKIVEAAELKPTDTVLEIGPGLGVLTEELVGRVNKVIAIEKDDGLANKLNVKCQMSNVKNIEILNQDILDVNVPGLKVESYKLVANIPYYITAKILEKFLTAENKPELIVLLVQKEVAERICARPHSASSGQARSTSSGQAGGMSLLSVSVQLYGQPEIVETVEPSSFFPEPKIESAILKVSSIKYQASSIKEEDLFKVARAGFHARRKTLLNNLMVGTNLDKKTLSDILKKIGLSEKVRAQELSIDQWQTLTNLTQNSKL